MKSRDPSLGEKTSRIEKKMFLFVCFLKASMGIPIVSDTSQEDFLKSSSFDDTEAGAALLFKGKTTQYRKQHKQDAGCYISMSQLKKNIALQT